MIPVALIFGTFGGHWCLPASPFCDYLRAHGFDPLMFEGWSGDVGGLWNPLSYGRDSDWKAGGHSLSYFLRLMASIYGSVPAVVGHSHGGNVIAECAALGRDILPAVVTVCTPVRADERNTYQTAQRYIGRWRHVSNTGGDWWQRLGEFGDRHLGWQTNMPLNPPHDNVELPGIDHHLLLTDPAKFSLWESCGLLDVLRTPAPIARTA